MTGHSGDDQALEKAKKKFKFMIVIALHITLLKMNSILLLHQITSNLKQVKQANPII